MIARRQSISKIILILMGVIALCTPAIAYRTYADLRVTIEEPSLNDFWRDYAQGIDQELYGVTIWAYLFGFSAILGISVFAALTVNAQLWVAAHPWAAILIAIAAPITALPITVISMNLSWICTLFFFGAAISCGLYLALHRDLPEMPIINTRRVT